MKNIILNKEDIRIIMNILEKFENIDSFEIEQSYESGIGIGTSLILRQIVNGYKAKIEIDITDYDKW